MNKQFVDISSKHQFFRTIFFHIKSFRIHLIKFNMSEEKPVEKPKELTNKELKELKKKEKLEKRQAKKVAQGIPIEKTVNQPSQQKIVKKQINEEIKPKKTIGLFSHLENKSQRQETLLTNLQINKTIHPLILKLTLKYSSYSIVGSIERCRSMLLTFKNVIKDYQTPENTTLTRNLTNYLSLQIDYLKTARPLSITMGNAIRWLKQEISVIPIDLPELEAKDLLLENIDSYIKEKIELSDKLIIKTSSNHIYDNSTILTFGHSNVLKELFLYNHLVLKKKFQVIIIDSRPLFEGKKLAEELTNSGLKVKYSLITSISTMFQDYNIDFVFLGAHAMLSNGFLYSRVGTALIAMKAKNKNIPVLVCCESIKFSDRVQLDSITLNELGDFKNLLNSKNEAKRVDNIALDQYLSRLEQPKKKQQEKEEEEKDYSLKNWESIDNLNILNIMYDLTPPEYIQKIITELGALPPSSVPVILREYKTQ